MRHRHRDAAEKTGEGDQAERDVGAQAKHPHAGTRAAGDAVDAAAFGRGPQHDRGDRHDQRDLDRGKDQHRLAPADPPDEISKNRRPDRRRDRRSASQQRQRRPAAPIKPARHIGVERRVDPGIAEQADKHAVPDQQAAAAAAACQHQPDRDHRRAEHHDPADADPLGDPAHQNSAPGGAEPGQRIGQRRHRAFAAEIGGDRLQGDDGHDRRAERHRGDAERGQGDDPGGAGLDRHPLRQRCRGKREEGHVGRDRIRIG